VPSFNLSTTTFTHPTPYEKQPTMGILDRFTRRGAATDNTNNAPISTHNNGTTARHHEKGIHDHQDGYLNRRPTFGQWLKGTWVDILTMIALGAIGLGVYEADPAPTRSFPINFVDGVSSHTIFLTVPDVNTHYRRSSILSLHTHFARR
jgi:hypothetical protein